MERRAAAPCRGPFFAPLSVSFVLQAKRLGLERVLAAAYAQTGSAFVGLSGSPRGRLRVRLRPKRRPTRRALEALAASFQRALSETEALPPPGAPPGAPGA